MLLKLSVFVYMHDAARVSIDNMFGFGFGTKVAEEDKLDATDRKVLEPAYKAQLVVSSERVTIAKRNVEIASRLLNRHNLKDELLATARIATDQATAKSFLDKEQVATNKHQRSVEEAKTTFEAEILAANNKHQRSVDAAKKTFDDEMLVAKNAREAKLTSTQVKFDDEVLLRAETKRTYENMHGLDNRVSVRVIEEMEEQTALQPGNAAKWEKAVKGDGVDGSASSGDASDKKRKSGGFDVPSTPDRRTRSSGGGM